METFLMILNCELLDLRAFVAVADGKSFQGAAAQLHLSQPALSRRIQKLETAVGTPLLQRSTRHVRLSPAGQEVLPMLRRLLDEMDSSLFGMMALGERRAGKLTIASVPSATVRFLPEVVQQFSRRHRIQALQRHRQRGLRGIRWLPADPESQVRLRVGVPARHRGWSARAAERALERG